MSSEPVISDEELNAFASRVCLDSHSDDVKEALADFLKGRVPPAKPQGDYAIDDLCDLASDNGFNACRDIVLKGTKT